MRFRINADLFRAVSIAVSTEETRYYLNGVNVEPHPVRGVILTATDGHRLLSAHDENGETDGTYIVPAGKDVIRATKIGGPERRRTGGGLVMVADGGSVTFRNAYDEATVTLPVKPVDGTFPDWRRVLPAAPDQAAVASYNPAYVSDLADVCADLKAAGFEGVAFTMAAADPGSPALVNYGMAPIFGVLMPMRNCIPLAIPAWVRARPAEDAIPYGQTSAMAAASHATPSDAPSCPSDAPLDPAEDAPQAIVQDEAEPVALHKPVADEVTRALADRLAEICKAVVTDRNDGADDCEVVAGICGRAWVLERQSRLCDAVETFDAMPAADPANQADAGPIQDAPADAAESCPADDAEYCPIVVLVTGRLSTITARQYRIYDAVTAFESMPEPAADQVKPSGLATMRAAALSSTAMVPPGVVVPFMPRRAA